MTNVFTGGAVIAGAESVERIGNAVDVIEEFADDRAPSGGVRENVVGGEFETLRETVLQLHRETVVAGAIVGTEERNIWRGSWQRKTGDEFVAAILVDTLLVFIGCGDSPILREIMFESGAGLQRVRRVVIGIDERALTAVCAAGQARGIGGIVGDAGRDGLIDGGERVHPAVLREVVVIEADSSAEHRMLRSARGIGEAETWSNGFAVVVRNAAVDELDAERLKSLQGGILRLVATGSGKQTEGGVIAKAGVDIEGTRDAPTIFGVKTKAAERLGESAIAGGSIGANGVCKGCSGAIVVGGELRGTVEIEGWILGELDEMFSGGGEGAAKNGFMNEVDAKSNLMAARIMGDIVAELIFLLVACDGKRGDDGGELIVAKSFESRGGVKICAERKSQSEAEIGVAIFDVVKTAGFKRQNTNRGRSE